MKNRKRYIEVPSTWDELTEADWRELLKLRHLVATTDHQWTAADVRTETARLLLKNRGVSTQPGDQRYLLLLAGMQQRLTWLWQEGDGGLSLVYRSTANLLPRVLQWLGPQSHGADLVFGEFRQAVEHMRQWERQRNPTALAALAGLLYRPQATDEQRHTRQLRRQPYDWDLLDTQIERGRAMRPWQRWGAYAWMAYFCEYLTTGTFIIDGCEVTFAPLFQNAQDAQDNQGNRNSLQRIALTLAGSHVFGTLRDVDHTPLLTVMQKLLDDYETLVKLKKHRKP